MRRVLKSKVAKAGFAAIVIAVLAFIVFYPFGKEKLSTISVEMPAAEEGGGGGSGSEETVFAEQKQLEVPAPIEMQGAGTSDLSVAMARESVDAERSAIDASGAAGKLAESAATYLLSASKSFDAYDMPNLLQATRQAQDSAARAGRMYNDAKIYAAKAMSPSANQAMMIAEGFAIKASKIAAEASTLLDKLAKIYDGRLTEIHDKLVAAEARASAASAEARRATEYTTAEQSYRQAKAASEEAVALVAEALPYTEYLAGYSTKSYLPTLRSLEQRATYSAAEAAEAASGFYTIITNAEKSAIGLAAELGAAVKPSVDIYNSISGMRVDKAIRVARKLADGAAAADKTAKDAEKWAGIAKTQPAYVASSDARMSANAIISASQSSDKVVSELVAKTESSIIEYRDVNRSLAETVRKCDSGKLFQLFNGSDNMPKSAASLAQKNAYAAENLAHLINTQVAHDAASDTMENAKYISLSVWNCVSAASGGAGM